MCGFIEWKTGRAQVYVGVLALTLSHSFPHQDWQKGGNWGEGCRGGERKDVGDKRLELETKKMKCLSVLPRQP